MVKVSIILPIYNVQDYLEKCLNSLINQTLEDIEIICINDCSTDNSLKILEEFAIKDSRIIITNLIENKGQGYARNIGIELAKGEYIGFVDPDDWAELNMFEEMYKEASKYNVEILETSRTRVRLKNNKFKAQINHIKNLPTNKTYNIHSLQNFVFKQPFATWNKIFKTSFIKNNKILFANSKCGEDMLFTIKARLLAKNIKYIKKSFYNYFVRAGSSVANPEYTKYYLKITDIISEIEQLAIANYLPTTIQTEFLKFRIDILAYYACRINKDSIIEYDNTVKTILSEEDYKKYIKLKQPRLSFIERIFSVKKVLINCYPHKVITILGFAYTYQIKSPIQSNKALR